MNRLTDNDKNWWIFTLARWNKTIGIRIGSGGDEDRESFILAVAFGRAVRMKLPQLLKPFGKYKDHPKTYGFSLSDMGNGYDFFQLFFGPQTHDSSTTKSWCKHLPWKQWRCVRHSIYSPDGSYFYTEESNKCNWMEYFDKKNLCPASHFGFEDYDGEMIVATCIIEEREWHRGEGWFKWLRRLYPPKICRSLDLLFSAEVGPQKGSWKGGTIGHGIDMLKGEAPQQAFERYCAKDHERKGFKFKLRFIGSCQEDSPLLAKK